MEYTNVICDISAQNAVFGEKEVTVIVGVARIVTSKRTTVLRLRIKTDKVNYKQTAVSEIISAKFALDFVLRNSRYPQTQIILWTDVSEQIYSAKKEGVYKQFREFLVENNIVFKHPKQNWHALDHYKQCHSDALNIGRYMLRKHHINIPKHFNRSKIFRHEPEKSPEFR